MASRAMEVVGPLAPYVPRSGADLVGRGYGSQTVRQLLALMAHVSRWLAVQGLAGDDLTTVRVERFLLGRRAGGWRSRVSTGGIAPVLLYLRSVGAVPTPITADVETPVEDLISRYRRYLVGERGLSSDALRGYLRQARAFFVRCGISGEVDLQVLAGSDVVAYLRSQTGRCSVGYAKLKVTQLRSLLRFLQVEGLTSCGLASAVPSVAGWRLTTLPAGVSHADVVRLLDSCDRRGPVGRRDYAMLLILTRLGLRAGEVAGLRLADIDWRTGEVTIHGKGNREDRLPLPHDVGEAIVNWLIDGRIRCDCPTVFTRVHAPNGSLSAAGVSDVVRHACGRCGLAPVGAHSLRHYVATDLLRAGGSLGEVGQVLRHRSPAVTSIYARVDRAALAVVVQPWPGGVS